MCYMGGRFDWLDRAPLPIGKVDWSKICMDVSFPIHDLLDFFLNVISYFLSTYQLRSRTSQQFEKLHF